MPIVTKPIREGPRFAYRILAVAERNIQGRLICPTIEFFHNAEVHEPRDLLKLSEYLTHLAETGRILDNQKFKRLDPTDLYELKTRAGLRLICFYGEKREIICTNGAIKKKDDLAVSDLDIAGRWNNLYFTAKNSNTLTHESEYYK